MKTFRHPDAFPLEDAGVHNAIKNLLNITSLLMLYKAFL
jgi:3-methyladenine DNA glycosylase/8-oxoguanine DNA glycosylase